MQKRYRSHLVLLQNSNAGHSHQVAKLSVATREQNGVTSLPEGLKRPWNWQFFLKNCVPVCISSRFDTSFYHLSGISKTHHLMVKMPWNSWNPINSMVSPIENAMKLLEFHVFFDGKCHGFFTKRKEPHPAEAIHVSTVRRPGRLREVQSGPKGSSGSSGSCGRI